MSHTALRPESFATDSNLLREISEVFDRGLVDNPNVTPSLSGLFPLSDLWYSSHAPSHRPSTFTTHELRLVLSQSKPRLKLCRWLGGSVQKFHTPYFLQSSILTYYKHSPQRVSESSRPTQYIFEGDSLSLFLFSSYIISKLGNNVKTILPFSSILFLSWGSISIGHSLTHPTSFCYASYILLVY